MNEPANVFCDNEAVYENSAFAGSQLKRKHQSICYYLVREAVATGKIIVHKVDSKDNLADLLTKSVPAHRHKYLRSKTLFSEDKEWCVIWKYFIQIKNLTCIGQINLPLENRFGDCD